MKKRNLAAFIIIIAVIIIILFVLQKSADAPVAEKQIPEESTTNEISSSYIGLSIQAAQERAQELGEAFRVVNIDGEPQPVTMDYRPGRINASTVDGIVTGFSIEGE